MHPLILVGIFAVAAVVGYLLIRNVPSLLHTPLMSGMNAISGIVLLGALVATAAALQYDNQFFARFFGFAAIILAMLNVAGGFGVTHRMLRMFKRKEDKK